MAKTPSTMIPLGTPFPHFRLPDSSGNLFDTQELLSSSPQAVVVMFICNHCPYVKHIAKAIALVTAQMLEHRGVYVFGINSNDISRYPEDGPEKMKIESERLGYPFPYLLDESQGVAQSFRAACTPEFYLFDRNLKLAYRGQFDSSRPQNHIEPTGSELWAAFLDVIKGTIPSSDQQPSIGCNIKW